MKPFTWLGFRNTIEPAKLRY